MIPLLAALAVAQPPGPTPPPPDSPPGTAIVCFGRPSPIGAPVTLELNGASIGTLTAGTYARAFLPLGRVAIRVVGPADTWDSAFQLEPGERLYLKIGSASPSPKSGLKVEEESVEDKGFARSCGEAPVLFGGT